MINKFQIVISTTSSRLASAIEIAETFFSKTEIESLIVCQIHDSLKDKEVLLENCMGYKVLYSYDKGLARSRNVGLFCSSAEIVWMLDDDVEVQVDAALEAFNYLDKHKELDFLTSKFEIEGGDSYKNYKSDCGFHDLLSVLKVSSIELFLRRKSVLEKGITFDTRFGLGASFPSGEENILLTDLIRRDAKGIYLPVVTSTHPDISSGWRLDGRDNAFAKGAMLKRIFGFWSYFIVPVFYLKKVNEKRLSIYQACSCILNAVRAAFYFK